MILGIETSCDETAAALVTGDGEIRSNVVASQAELHARYGGVVPEVASRRHLELVSPVVREALAEAGARLDDVESVAVTQGPGLIGALLVGLSAAKALAWARGLPLVPVDHLHGHVASLYLAARPGRAAVSLPARERRPHAAARRARPRGLPGSRHLDRRRRRRGVRQGCAPARPRLPRRRGDRPAARKRATRRRSRFPVARLDGLDFSFSGLKTALLYKVRDLGDEAESRAGRSRRVATSRRSCARSSSRRREPRSRWVWRRIAVVGGVAANSELRAALPDARFAPLALCTDNAAMIASAGRYGRSLPYPRYLDLDAYASRT